MGIQKLLSLGTAVLALSACGNNTTPVATNTLTTTPLVTTPAPTATPSGTQTGNINGVTTAINGGARTQSPAFPYDIYSGYQTAQSYNSYQFTATATVAAGDIVIVQANSNSVTHTKGGLLGIGGTASPGLNNLSVKLDGATLGNGLVAQYPISKAGTLTFGGDWFGPYNASGAHSVFFAGGTGVFIVHCTTNDYKPMVCPY